MNLSDLMERIQKAAYSGDVALTEALCTQLPDASRDVTRQANQAKIETLGIIESGTATPEEQDRARLFYNSFDKRLIESIKFRTEQIPQYIQDMLTLAEINSQGYDEAA